MLKHEQVSSVSVPSTHWWVLRKGRHLSRATELSQWRGAELGVSSFSAPCSGGASNISFLDILTILRVALLLRAWWLGLPWGLAWLPAERQLQCCVEPCRSLAGHAELHLVCAACQLYHVGDSSLPSEYALYSLQYVFLACRMFLVDRIKSKIVFGMERWLMG